jgi:hypothetical protein
MRRILAAATMGLVSVHAASGQTPLTLVGTIDLPGVEGRIDHLEADRRQVSAGARLRPTRRDQNNPRPAGVPAAADEMGHWTRQTGAVGVGWCRPGWSQRKSLVKRLLVLCARSTG